MIKQSKKLSPFYFFLLLTPIICDAVEPCSEDNIKSAVNAVTHNASNAIKNESFDSALEQLFRCNKSKYKEVKFNVYIEHVVYEQLQTKRVRPQRKRFKTTSVVTGGDAYEFIELRASDGTYYLETFNIEFKFKNNNVEYVIVK